MHTLPNRREFALVMPMLAIDERAKGDRDRNSNDARIRLVSCAPDRWWLDC